MTAHAMPRPTDHPEPARPSVLVGLFGTGIQASKTPALHEREGAEQGLRYLYKLVDFDAHGLAREKLAELVAGAQHLGFAGLNITHPFKQQVVPLLDAMTPEAEALGAVNTLVFEAGQRIGHNTDWWGFAESFRRELADVPRRRVLQVGAGGAGAAVAYALLSLGTERLVLVDVDAGRAERLAADMAERFPGRCTAATTVDAVLPDADGIVNATPIGMAKYPGSPVPAALLRPSHWVADIIYFPAETELLAAARALGCRTMGGGGMAIFQAVGAFRLFTGRPADAERMTRHFQSL